MTRLLLWIMAIVIGYNLIRLIQAGRKLRQSRREDEGRAPEIPPLDSIPDAEFEDLGSDEKPTPPPAP
jgi:hypothetical protein